jgi:hypothetical protein
MSDRLEPQSWAAFQAAAPDLAAAGRTLLQREGRDGGFLVSVRGDSPPRIHPVSVGIVGGGLYVFVLPSAKRTDLEQDGRFAFHAHLDPEVPGEFSIRGRAKLVDDRATRDAVAASWSFEPDDTYALFELRILTVVVGRRASAEDWPPAYETWSAARA